MKYKVTLNDKNYEIEVERGEAIMLDVSEAPTAILAAPAPVAAAPAAAVAPAPAVAAPVAQAVPASPAQAPPAPAATVFAGGEVLRSPMPGSVLLIKAAVGQQVKKGEVLLILEAMKMENEIAAPRDATITQVVVKQGASVNTGEPLLILK
jgi:glutaconyl-CoA decarboxylase